MEEVRSLVRPQEIQTVKSLVFNKLQQIPQFVFLPFEKFDNYLIQG